MKPARLRSDLHQSDKPILTSIPPHAPLTGRIGRNVSRTLESLKMYSLNMQPTEIERIAYLNGDYATAGQFATLADTSSELEELENDIDNALDLVGCSGKRGTLLYAAMSDLSDLQDGSALTAAMMAMSAVFHAPGAVSKKRLLALSSLLCDLAATPQDFDAESARKAVYESLGFSV